MGELKTIAYISRTNQPFTQQELDGLLQEAQTFNMSHQVTGVLLHNPGFFFQYIEGPSASIDKVYQRIQASKRHEVMMELCNEVASHRYFDGWNMGFCRAPHGMVQALSHQQWIRNLNAISDRALTSEGLKMLLLFWQNLASDARSSLDR